MIEKLPAERHQSESTSTFGTTRRELFHTSGVNQKIQSLQKESGVRKDRLLTGIVSSSECRLIASTPCRVSSGTCVRKAGTILTEENDDRSHNSGISILILHMGLQSRSRYVRDNPPRKRPSVSSLVFFLSDVHIQD